MIYSLIAPTLLDELGGLKNLIAANEKALKRTVIFCEDRLTLVAERTVCAVVGGSFNTSVYTFARFLSNERGSDLTVLSSQGSAMAIRAIIEANKDRMRLFKRLSASSAAQSLYDTIAILYSSGINIEELVSLDAGSPLLSDKLHDISLVYTEYVKFLKESGRTDRNMYLRLLPDAICSSGKTAGADIVLLGFQAFTGTTLQCVKACMRAGADVYGLFTGGEQDIYANEAHAQFYGCAKEYGGCRQIMLKSSLKKEAEYIRQNLFEPQSFNKEGVRTDCVHIFEGADETQEMEFIAANIKKHVIDDGVRYAKISVMLPNADYARETLARVFSSYRIPYYVDERRKIEGHPLTQFLCDYIECVAGGCAPSDVNGVTGSFLFGLSQKERDIFRNYLLRCANYRGGVKRQPAESACSALGFDFKAVTAVRERFLEGLSLLPKNKADIADWTAGILKLLEFFDCKNILEELAESCENDYPAQSQFYLRAYDAVTSVIDEAREVVPREKYSAREYKKLVKSGFSAAEISLIPPKADAVFVGDISTTVNTGSDVVFACGLTDAVPPAGADTALLTDREISSLEKLNLQISPKIAQVNRRCRETVALNLCAFRQSLYITYPAASGGQEQTRSEIIPYICKFFVNSGGKNISAVTSEQIKASGRGLAYYCSEEVPALGWLASGGLKPDVNSALYNVICENGGEYAADTALTPPEPKQNIQGGKELFTGGKASVSPTLLETYFSCPYKNFLSRGVRLSERKEGDVHPLDTGNFIHAVLQRMAGRFKTYGDGLDGEEQIKKEEEAVRKEAKDIAEELLKTPEYSELGESLSGRYMVERLVNEAQEVAAGACEQLLAGDFRVRDCEKWYDLPLSQGIKAGGRIDRVDQSKDGMVRVIDYKTGGTDIKLESYYAGIKLQLPLYLSAAAGENRAAGAYYFPANLDYKDEDGVFTLQGFMDASEGVVKASDRGVGTEKSKYINAKLGGRKPKTNMPTEVFGDFLGYSRLIAKQGAEEIFSGNICPSPYSGVCEYCKFGGMCGFSSEKEDARKVDSVSGEDIAEITRSVREAEDE
ncbi:MAG: PD-(D/E)XK nuclease family protein [Clostridia bacterium]|nr:PD-(D/E)XK nuclease family protein [Clostridia bacterium]